MLLPRTLRWSRVTGFFPRNVSFTVFKCVFMLMSTPAQCVFSKKSKSHFGNQKPRHTDWHDHWLAQDKETTTYICMTWTTRRKTCKKEVREIFVFKEAKSNGADIYLLQKGTCDGAMHYCAILQFYGNRLVVELHKKPGAHSQKNPSSAAKPLPVFNPPHIFAGRSKTPPLNKTGAEINKMRSRHFCRWIPIVSYRSCELGKRKKKERVVQRKHTWRASCCQHALVVARFCRNQTLISTNNCTKAFPSSYTALSSPMERKTLMRGITQERALVVFLTHLACVVVFSTLNPKTRDDRAWF